jgi:hypothetical protein
VSTEDREQREQAVLGAARDERRERKALEALGARQPGWTEAEELAHQAQLQRWLAASRRLADALHSLRGSNPGQVLIRRL